jgi:hypothetical protein
MVHVTEVRAASVEFPPGRYGHRRDPRGRRWLPAVAAVVIIALGLAVTFKLYRQYGVPPYQVAATTVTDVTPTSVKISFEVRVPDGKGAVCTLRARDRRGAEIGRTEVTLPAGGPGVRTLHGTHTLSTTGQSFYAEVLGCGPAR